MKMDFLTSGLFWGTILVLIGLSIILKVVFDINIPVIRILFALLLIYWGMKLIMGISFKKEDGNTAVFSEEKMKFNKERKEYTTIFGKSTIDLTDLSSQDSLKNSEINVVFGASEILIREDIPLKIKSSAAFGSVEFPDETVISFGERVYKTASYRDQEKYTEVTINVVFGSAKIRTVKNTTTNW